MIDDDEPLTSDGPREGAPTDKPRAARRRSVLSTRGYRWRNELTEAELDRARHLLARADRSFNAVAAELGIVPRVLARHFPDAEAEASGPRRRAQRPKLADNGGQSLKGEIAAQIAAALREHGISQRAFAALIGKTSGAVQNLLNPETNVTLANLARTAAALGLELRVELRRASAPAGDPSPEESE
jgi:hypothetical protein